jgi:polygalacturonase
MSRAYAADQKSGPSGAPSASVFLPRQFGAIGDGRALDSPAIKAAIDACNKGGGGVVYCPPGRYLCGTVELKSNVTLYLGTC